VHAVRDFGHTIKRLRLEREMTQQELADASGLGIRYIGSIERGQRNPTFGVLQGKDIEAFLQTAGQVQLVSSGVPDDLSPFRGHYDVIACRQP